MDFLAFVIAVAASISLWRLKARVKILEDAAASAASQLRAAHEELAAIRGSGIATDEGSDTRPAVPAQPPASDPSGPEKLPLPAPPTSVPAAVTSAPRRPARPTSATLEERLGTRWAVWIGGLALAAGGLLLVRYSIEQGVFGPGVRVALGAMFAAVLVGLGEWLRRGKTAIDFAALPSAHIPGILTAAGTMAAFATIYAAHALYGFIGTGSAFVLLGATGIATMVAAALHGLALAGLGLAGALATPLLVSQSIDPSPWPLVIYLAIVAAAAYALARARRWLWLAATVVIGVVLWGVLLYLDGPSSLDWALARQAHLIVQLALAALFLAVEPHMGADDATANTDYVAGAAMAALTFLAVIVFLTSTASGAAWTLTVLTTCAVLAGTAWLAGPVAVALPLAGVAALAAALAWPGLSGPPDTRFLWPAIAEIVRLPDSIRGYLAFTVLLSLGLLAVGTLRLWQGRALRMPASGLYALGAILTPLAVLIMVYLRVTQFDRSIPFALCAVILAAILYVVADRFDNVPEERKSAHSRLMISFFAAGCTAAMALAFTMALERGYLTVAFAVTAATTALFAVIDKIPSLRWMVGAIGFVVLARLGWDPRIAGADVGVTPIFNWLLLGYGAPAAAFLFAGHVLRREKDDLPARLADALGLLFAALLIVFQIRHLLNGGDIRTPASSHVEQGLLAFTALGFAAVLNRLDLAKGNPVFRWAMIVAGTIGALLAVGGLLLVENPYLNGDAVAGWPVVSTLMLAYLLPGAAAVAVARGARGVRPVWHVTGAAVLALVLIVAYATLETRHLFQGAHITVLRPTSSAEMWAYSAVWLALGLIFLAYGLVRSCVEARIASAILVVIAVVKVFVFDTSGVTGIWRPLSFICLGVVLMGIGLVYQRLIFAKPPGPAAQMPPSPPGAG